MNFIKRFFQGRLARANYLVGSFLLGMLIFAAAAYANIAILYLVQSVATLFGVSLAVRRVHDFNWTGWYGLIVGLGWVSRIFASAGLEWLVPVVISEILNGLGLAFVLVLWLKPGTEGANAYGKVPTKKIEPLTAIFPMFPSESDA